MSAVPETGQTELPTIEFCRQAVKSQSYVTATSNSVPIRIDELPTYIPEVLVGEIMVTSGVATCLGEETKYKGKVMKQAMILQETHFTIRKVKIRKNFDSGDLMLVESSTTIPAHLTKSGVFSIDSGTYIIPRVQTPCAYQIIKTFLGSDKPTNRPDDLITTSQNRTSAHPHSWKIKTHQTGHLNIIVFQPSPGLTTAEEAKFDNIDARQVSIPNMITLKVEWALYKTSKKFGLVHDVSQQAECTALKRLTSGDQTQPELQGSSESLLYAKGEMLYDVKCPRIEASLDLTTTDNRCYKYLPVVTGNPPVRRFLIPGSRLLSNVSEIEPCEDAQKVPEDIYLQEGIGWLRAHRNYNWKSSPCQIHTKKRRRVAPIWTEIWPNGQGCSCGTPEGQSPRLTKTGSHNPWVFQTSSEKVSRENNSKTT